MKLVLLVLGIVKFAQKSYTHLMPRFLKRENELKQKCQTDPSLFTMMSGHKLRSEQTVFPFISVSFSQGYYPKVPITIARLCKRGSFGPKFLHYLNNKI